MTAHSGPHVAELVRLDLVHRESEGMAPGAFYVGPTAILDAYDLALDLTCYLRALIEDMKIGDGTMDAPTYKSQPHHDAARLRTAAEEHALRPAVPGGQG